MTVLATVTDPDGRVVDLTAERWGHIAARHPELDALRDEILRAVEAPDHRGPDPMPGRERYWRRHPGPFPWLRVVVDFNVEPASIVTAFPNRRRPPE